MIWIVLGIVLWGTALFLVTPLISKPADDAEGVDYIAAYKAEIDRIDFELETSNDESLHSKKIEFQRKLIQASQETRNTEKPLSRFAVATIFGFIIFGGIGLYTLLGHPDQMRAPLAAETKTETEIPKSTADLVELVDRLGRKLEKEQDTDPLGWTIHARSLMRLGRFEEAFLSYGKVLELTDNDENARLELERAKQVASQSTGSRQPVKRGPTEEDIKAAAQMSEDDRSAMIDGMVNSLAARLRENPDSPEDWIKLLRSRKVSGQEQEALSDIQFLRKYYVARPDIVDQIIKNAGWSDKD